MDEYIPKNIWKDAMIGTISGKCICGNTVKNFHNYCYKCGIKLNWNIKNNNYKIPNFFYKGGINHKS